MTGVLKVDDIQDAGANSIVSSNGSGTLTFGNFTAATITASTALVPDASDGAALGTTALEWSDLFLADGAVINLGDDQEVTLTHVADTGITLNSTNKLMFNDASQFIQGASATVLDIAATDEIELTATLIEVVGNATVSGTLGVTGVTTSNAGVVVDNITIDGTEIDLSSGDLTIDVAGDIKLDAAGGNILFQQAGTTFFDIQFDNSDAQLISRVSDKDIVFRGNDAGSIITALTLDMSAAGAATFNSTVTTSTGLTKTVGKETIWVPAQAMSPTASNGCAALATVETTSGRPDMNVLDFDKDSDEHAQFSIAFPKSWNEGTITFQVFWSSNASSDGCSWGLQGVAVGNNDTIDVAYGTAVVVDDSALAAVEEICVSPESGAVTIAGSPAVDQLCFFRIFRDVSDGNDTMAADGRLHGIKIFYTTDASNDA